MAGMITVPKKYWKRWTVHLDRLRLQQTRILNEVTWEQRVMEGNPKSMVPRKSGF